MDTIVNNIESIKKNTSPYKTQLSSFIEQIEKINKKIDDMTNITGNDITSLLIKIRDMDNLLKSNTYDEMESMIKTENENWKTFMTNFSLFLTKIPEDENMSLDNVLDVLNDNLLELSNSLDKVMANINTKIHKSKITKRIKLEFPELVLNFKINDERHTQIVTTSKTEYMENGKTIAQKGKDITEIIESIITNAFTEDILEIILNMDSSLYSTRVLRQHAFVKNHLEQQNPLSGGDIDGVTTKLTEIEQISGKFSEIFELCETINIKFSQINNNLSEYKINYYEHVKNHNDNVYFMLYMQKLTEKTIEYPIYIPLLTFSEVATKTLMMENKLKPNNEINNYMNERYGVLMESLFDFIGKINTKITETYPTATSNEIMIDVFSCDTTTQYMFNALYQFQYIIDEYNKYSE